MQLIYEKSVTRPARGQAPGLRCAAGRRAPGQPAAHRAPAALPEVTELDVVRHFTNLSRRNFSVDTNFYPLGSCTMKYNAKASEKAARLFLPFSPDDRAPAGG